MDTRILAVESTEQIETVAHLAKQIWEQHFTPIIGANQVAYMLKNFQSSRAIQEQINQGAVYFAAKYAAEGTAESATESVSEPAGKWIGYMGLIPSAEQNKVMLSKLYVKDSARGKGAGKALLNHAERYTADAGMTALWLTVNRFNDTTINWYKRQGFVVVDEQKKDIGNGFFMDDFIMQKEL